MPEREPNFNDRLQAMAARALLLAAQREAVAATDARNAARYDMWHGTKQPRNQRTGVRAPVAFPNAGPAAHLVNVQARPMRELELHRLDTYGRPGAAYYDWYNASPDPTTARKPAAGSTQNRAIERLMQTPYYKHANMLLDREPTSDPMHPVSVFNRDADSFPLPGYSPQGFASDGDRMPYPYNMMGREARATLSGVSGINAYDPGALPVTQGPPTPGFDAEKEAARQLAALFALFPTRE